MAKRALFLVHDDDPDRGPAETGTLREHAEAHGFNVTIEVPGLDESAVDGYDLLVVMGSVESAYDDRVSWLAAELDVVTSAIERDVPVLGVCFGGQLLARALGATVQRAAVAERGFIKVETKDPELIPPGPWMSFHYDEFSLPADAQLIAENEACRHAFTKGRHLGLQFHPEISPSCFQAWYDSWAANDEVERVARSGVDIDGMRREVDARAEQSRADCGQLFDTFWTRQRLD